MARIRTIKPEFWTSEQIVECSPNARLLFIGLWNFCDDAGRHPASAKRLKMEVFPADPIETAQVSKWIDELISAGLIESYTVKAQWFWQVTGWHHQRIDQPTIKYPNPQGFVEHSPNRRRTVAECSPPEGKGREGNKKESIRKKMRVPTLDDVRAFCAARDNSVDPEKFHAHYTANGWRQGKGTGRPIKDWKAAVITWERNGRSEQVCQVPTAEELTRYNPVTGIQ